MNISNSLEKELDATRRKWLVAKKRGDTTMCLLWEKVGKSIKERIIERSGVTSAPATSEQIVNIFGGELTN